MVLFALPFYVIYSSLNIYQWCKKGKNQLCFKCKCLNDSPLVKHPGSINFTPFQTRVRLRVRHCRVLHLC